MAIGVQDANATIVVTNANAKVGFDTGAGFGANFTAAVVPGQKFIFNTNVLHNAGHTYDQVKFGKSGNLSFRGATGPKHTLRFIPAGTGTFSNIGNGGQPVGVVGSRRIDNGSLGGDPAFSNRYAMFKFTAGPTTFYGWVQLSLGLKGQANPSDGTFGPDLTIINYAYDDSGAKIQAGNTGSGSAAPEPGTFVTTGLAALALGATGLRRWRSARKP